MKRREYLSQFYLYKDEIEDSLLEYKQEKKNCIFGRWGPVTVCVKPTGPNRAKFGVSICSKDEKFNKKSGKLIAWDRCRTPCEKNKYDTWEEFSSYLASTLSGD